jgi:hypothetical protein
MGTPPHLVERIYDRWVAQGSPLCTHTHRDTVQDMGVPPEENVCKRCGIRWDRGDALPEPCGNDA